MPDAIAHKRAPGPRPRLQLVHELAPLHPELVHQAEQALLPLGLPEPDLEAALAPLKARSELYPDWRFIMVNPEQFSAVHHWLATHAKRPLLACQVWTEMLACVRWDTGELVARREHFARKFGVPADEISRIFGDLARRGAIRAEGEGRARRYWMNPHCATHLVGKEAGQPGPGAKARAETPPPELPGLFSVV